MNEAEAALNYSVLFLLTPLVEATVREADMREKCSFFKIVQKAFDPPPLSFEHHVGNFF